MWRLEDNKMQSNNDLSCYVRWKFNLKHKSLPCHLSISPGTPTHPHNTQPHIWTVPTRMHAVRKQKQETNTLYKHKLSLLGKKIDQILHTCKYNIVQALSGYKRVYLKICKNVLKKIKMHLIINSYLCLYKITFFEKLL